MEMESIAVLRWIPGAALEDGEDAVVAILEPALHEAVTGNGLQAHGPMTIRPVGPDEYPQAQAGRPADDPSAVLHLAEVAVRPR